MQSVTGSRYSLSVTRLHVRSHIHNLDTMRGSSFLIPFFDTTYCIVQASEFITVEDSVVRNMLGSCSLKGSRLQNPNPS